MALWTTILKQAPALIAAADALLVRTRQASAPGSAAGDLQALRQRVAEIEGQQRAQADLDKQLADQINALVAAAQAAAATARQALLVAGIGTLLAVVAILLAFLR